VLKFFINKLIYNNNNFIIIKIINNKIYEKKSAYVASPKNINFSKCLPVRGFLEVVIDAPAF
jgi:hypothetical protein